jgi:hypothetical protein
MARSVACPAARITRTRSADPRGIGLDVPAVEREEGTSYP